MTSRAATLFSERWLDQVLIRASGTLAAGEIVDQVTLPAGIGDLAIMELEYRVETLATAIAAIDLEALEVLVRTANQNVDIVGVEYFKKIGVAGTAYAAYMSPDPLVLWRQTESLQCRHTDLDINGSPTYVFDLMVKCVRVRPTETIGKPLQLVAEAVR